MLIQNASWITMEGAASTAVPVFRKRFAGGKHVRSAVLEVTCDGVYEAVLNGRRVGNFMLAPGWTEYRKRLQVQSYDVTNLLDEDNTLEITVANGWFRQTNAPWTGTKNPDEFLPAMLIAALRLVRDDDMNSYNHYAYGSVADWVFSAACGIQPAKPGFAEARIAPLPDPRVKHLSAVLDTVHGRIRSFWKYTENGIRYEIDTPVRTEIVLDGRSRVVEKGSYVLFSGQKIRDMEA